MILGSSNLSQVIIRTREKEALAFLVVHMLQRYNSTTPRCDVKYLRYFGTYGSVCLLTTAHDRNR